MLKLLDAPDGELWSGNCLDVLSQLPEASVDMVVTSPPYWGLRKYSGEQELVWGGMPDCEHEWGEQSYQRRSNDGGVEGRKQTTNAGAIGREEPIHHAFCFHCGAWRGSFGLEPTIELYIAHSMEIMRAIRRVLKPGGTVWWNLGDSYAHGKTNPHKTKRSLPEIRNSGWTNREQGTANTLTDGLKPLDLCLIPERFALAAQADGWYIRSRIVWAKPNPMPESVKGWRWERCKVKVKRQISQHSHNNLDANPSRSSMGPDFLAEYADCPGCPRCLPNDGYVLRKGSWRPTEATDTIWMLAADKEYFSDGESVRQPYSGATSWEPYDDYNQKGFEGSLAQATGDTKHRIRMGGPKSGANLRNLWAFPTQGFGYEMCEGCGKIYTASLYRRLTKVKHQVFNEESEEWETKEAKKCNRCGRSDAWMSHFATFPERLPELCILAGSPEKVCSECGKPWVRIVKHDRPDFPKALRAEPYSHGGANSALNVSNSANYKPTVETLGFRPSCRCEAEPAKAIVLDPFVGSGTTCVVARKLGRRWIGIDLSEHYLALAQKRLEEIPLSLL